MELSFGQGWPHIPNSSANKILKERLSSRYCEFNSDSEEVDTDEEEIHEDPVPPSNSTSDIIKHAMEINQQMRERLLAAEQFLLNRLEKLSFMKKGKQPLEKRSHVQKKKLAAKSFTENEITGNSNLTANNAKLGSIKDFYSQFGMPYFRDNDDVCPPNEDTLKKICNKEFNFCRMVRPHWLVNELKILDEEVSRKSSGEVVDWENVSQVLKQHSASECRRMWELWLKPPLKRGSWTKVEEERLLEVATRHGFKDWHKIASEFGPSRSRMQCFIHYRKRLARREFNQGRWSPEEDRTLQMVVAASTYKGHISWHKVCYYIEDRTFPQIYARWNNSLTVNKMRFTPEEDKAILEGVFGQGLTCHQIATVLEGRNARQVRERFENQLRTQIELKFGEWNVEEDKKLLQLVKKYGTGKWAAIAKEFSTRNRMQVRHRYKLLSKNVSDTGGLEELDLTRLRRWKRANSLTRAEINRKIVNALVK